MVTTFLTDSRRRLGICAVLLIVLILQGCASSPTPTPYALPSYWPTHGWRSSTPEQQGMDSQMLANMLAEIQEWDYDIDSVLIVRNGFVVVDAYMGPFGPEQTHIVHSVTKSIVSALIGIAIEQEHIEGVHQAVLDIFTERVVDEVDERKERITLEHLLTMSSGLDCQDSYLYRWEGLRSLRVSEDWVQYMLDLPMAHEPGTHFEYCNGGSFLLSAIIQETTGETALAYADMHLFTPLGIDDVIWPANAQGINIGWGELHLRPHDMAKLGYLYLNNGRWDGRQIVPNEWVRMSTRKHIDAHTLQESYGYQWWIADPDMYMALGYAGQYIVVVPEQNLVVVFTSSLPDQQFTVPEQLMKRHILTAITNKETLPPNPAAYELLDSLVNELAHPAP